MFSGISKAPIVIFAFRPMSSRFPPLFVTMDAHRRAVSFVRARVSKPEGQLEGTGPFLAWLVVCLEGGRPWIR